ncbi:MAG: PAS domain-containing protein [Pseudomonadota bacterium]
MEDGANIIQLSAARAGRDDPALRHVEQYWDGLREGRLMPSRAEIDPRGLSPALDRAFILERIAPGLARFRVAGRKLSEAMGLQVNGLPLSTCFHADARDRLADLLEGVFSEPNVVRLSLSAPTGIGRPPFGGQMILLPLRDDLGGMSRALGCLVTVGQIGRTPRRFVIDGAVKRSLRDADVAVAAIAQLYSEEETPA